MGDVNNPDYFASLLAPSKQFHIYFVRRETFTGIQVEKNKWLHSILKASMSATGEDDSLDATRAARRAASAPKQACKDRKHIDLNSGDCNHCILDAFFVTIFTNIGCARSRRAS